MKTVTKETITKETMGLAGLASNHACFVGGTLVKIPEFPYAKPIKDIKVGDYVMSRPENGIGEAVPKKVINTFHHKDKEIWYVGISRLNLPGYIITNLGVTPNHPFMVYGYTNEYILKDYYEVPKDIELKTVFYDEPRWTRVDQLRVGDIVRSTSKKDPYFIIESVKPFYKSFSPKYAYLQGGKDMSFWQSSTTGTYWMPNKTNSNFFGQIIDFGEEKENELVEPLTGENLPSYPLYNKKGYMGTMASGITYPIYTTDVYNIEVEDYHTYCVDTSGILVHNDNCGKTNLLL